MMRLLGLRHIIRFLALTCLLAAPAAQAGIEVYMGFMDEEVKFVLEELIKSGHPVYVVERAETMKNGKLFESPLSVYQRNAKGYTEFTARTVDFGGRLQKSLDDAAAEMAANVEILAADGAELKAGKKPKFRVLGFNTGRGVKASQHPIVLVRSPEMGLQPDLTRAHLRTIFEGISAQHEASSLVGGVHLSTFGTAGAVSPSVRPGDVADIGGSLYVGYERLPGTNQYQAVIKLSDGMGDPITFYKGKPVASVKLANDDVQRYFHSLESDPKMAPKLREIKSAVDAMAKNTDKKISMTT